MDEIDHIDDEEMDPNAEPKSSRAWLAQIVEAERAFESFQVKADAIDRLYADLARLANISKDREFQLFWANIQVLAPSIYSRPPVPVVVPKFKDRRPINRIASEMLERCASSAFDTADINSVMLLLRDDLAVVGRGCAWVRYETKKESDTDYERICIEHKDRKDFLHEPSRNWPEVGWVAGASYLTKKEMRKRFRKSSGDAYQRADYSVLREDRDNGGADNRRKCKVWELWSKTENKVVWVAKDVDVLLDEGEPHLKLEGFFPCPKPVYATTQRRSLIPVPDMLYYRDQIEEINQLTARIHALSEALRLKGFYAAGGEIGEAVETAMKLNDPGKIMVPVSNWAAFGGGSQAPILWLPIENVATTIAGVVELRKAIISDVYQIMGLSDIMRGSTDKDETLGAQQLKSQYGSVRIRDKQSELVRVARDIARIASEVIAENFSEKTMLEMSQLELPTNADIKKQIDGFEKQAEGIVEQARQVLAQVQQNPELMAQAQQNPEMAEQAKQKLQQQSQEQLQALQKQAQKVSETVTVDQVMDLLRDQKLRPFILDIETDSTIAPDEDAQKQRATEFMTVFSGAIAQVVPLLKEMPQAGPLAAEGLRFLSGQFRIGRSMEQSIDEFTDSLRAIAEQGPAPDPMQAKVEADAQATQAAAQTEQAKAQADIAAKEADIALKQKDAELTNAERAQALEAKQAAEQHTATLRQQDVALKDQEAGLKRQALIDGAAMAAEQHRQAIELGVLAIEKMKLEIGRVQVQTDATIATTNANVDATEAKTSAGIDAQAAGIEMKREAFEAAGAD